MDTTQVITLTSAAAWKFAFIGLAGFLLHWWKEIKDSRIEQTTWLVYWNGQKYEIIWGLLSYGVLVYLWHEGSIFTVLSYVGMDSPKIELNAGTFILGYFSSSIMTGATTLLQYVGEKVQTIFRKKIDSVGGGG